MKKALQIWALVAMLFVPWATQAQNELTVYDGTTTNTKVPAYIYYFDAYSRSQTVIPSDDLTEMIGGTISSMTFYTNSSNVPYTTTCSADVYLTEVDYTSISSFIATADATIVYQGTLTIESVDGGGQLTIEFSTPYTYNGGNLLIGIENTSKGSYKSINFLGQTVSGASVYGNNSSSLSGCTASAANFIPKTTFSYAPGGGGPICYKPGAITVEVLTATEASIGWTPGGDETSWNIYLNDELVASNVTDLNYTFTDLNPNTQYTLGVTAVCDEESQKRTVSVRTPCAAMSLPYTCGFEADELQGTSNSEALPWCAYRYASGTGSYTYYPYSYNSTNYAYNGSRSLYYYGSTYSSYPDTMVFILPAVDVNTYPMNGNRLSFWAKMSSASYSKMAYIGTMSDPNDINSFTLIDTVLINGTTYTKYTVSLANANADDAHVALVVFKGNGEIYLDDVTLEVMPSCVEISNLTASNITSNSVTLTWDDEFNVGAGYTIWDHNGLEPVTFGTTEPGVKTATLTNLPPNTWYTFAVAANCSADDNSGEVGISSLRTLNNACEITGVIITGDAYRGDAVVDSVEQSVTVPVRYIADLTTLSGNINSTGYQILIYDTQRGWRQYYGMQTIGQYITYNEPLTVRVMAEDTSIYKDWAITLVPEACSTPNSLTLTAERTSATAKWTVADPAAKNFQLVITEDTLDINELERYEAVEVSDTTTYTFTGLERETTYYVYLRTTCGEDGNSEWVMASITTKSLSFCEDVVIAEGTTTNQYLPIYGNWGDAAQRNQMLYPASMLSELQNKALTAMTFFPSSSIGNWKNNTITIKIANVTGASLESAFVETEMETVYSGNSLTGDATGMTITFPSNFTYTGGDLLIELNNEAGSYSSTNFYGVSYTNGGRYSYSSTNSLQSFLPKVAFTYCEQSDPCPAVAEVEVSDITETGATISWTASTGDYVGSYEVLVSEDTAISYNEVLVGDSVVYEVSGDVITVENGTTYTLGDLNAYTEYYVFVRAICNAEGHNEGSSTWQRTTFRTLSACGAVSNMVAEITGKNSATVSWEKTKPNQANNFNYILSTTANLTDEELNGMTPTGTGLDSQSVVLSGLENSTTYYIYVQNVCGSDDFSPWVSTIFTTYDAMPAVAYIFVADITHSAISVEWERNMELFADETAWQVACVPDSIEVIDWTVVTTPSHTFIGLNANTPYTIHVRPYNTETSVYGPDATLEVITNDMPAACEIVADGTTTHSKVPLDFYNTDGSSEMHAQMLYPSNLLTRLVGSPIESITFYHQSNVTKALSFSQWTIKMGVTTATDLSNGFDETTLTTVYTGNLEVTGGEFSFVFEDPFEYSGGNLIIDISLPSGSKSGNWFGSSNQGCYGVDGIGSTYSSMSSPNYTSFLPKVQFCYERTGDCWDLANVTVSDVTANSAHVSWIPGNVETEWQYALVSAETSLQDIVENPEILTTVSNQTSIDLTNLNADFDYYLYIRPVCGDTNYGNFTERKFQTLPTCGIPTVLPATNIGTTYATLHVMADSTVGTPMNYTFRVWPAGTEDYIMVTSTTDSVEIADLQPNTDYYYEAQTTCTDNNGSSRWSNQEMFHTDISCFPVSNLQVTEVTSNSVTLTWAAVEGISTYGLTIDSVYMTDASDTTITIEDLEPNTLYNFGVSVYCGQYNSEEVIVSARTACAPMPYPWQESFEASINSDPCWAGNSAMAAADVFNGDTLQLNAANAWQFTNSVSNGIEADHYKVNIYGTSCKKWLITPEIDLTEAPTAMLYFDAAFTTYSGNNPATNFDTNNSQAFMVLVSTDGGLTWPEAYATKWQNVGGQHTLAEIAGTEYVQQTVDLTQFVGGTIRIAFYAQSLASGGDNNLHLDNITVTEAPAVYPVSNLMVDNITANSVTLSWSNDPRNPDSTTFIVSDNFNTWQFDTTTATINGLTSNTTYTFYVMAQIPTGEISIDKSIEVTTGASCFPVSDLYFDEVTTESVTLSWLDTINNGATYTVDISMLINDSLETVATYNSQLTTITINGLTPWTAYYFNVYANCTANDRSDAVQTTTTTSCDVDPCIVSIVGHDSYGDGWQNAFIRVEQNSITLGSFTLASGSEMTTDYNVCGSLPVNFTWTKGTYDGECSFEIENANGTVYSVSNAGNLTDGETYTLETPCPSCPSPTGRIHGIARNNIYLECHTPNYLPVLITWNNDTLFTTDTFIDISGLNHNTLYDFELRTICDGEYSEPLTLSATTLDYCNYPIVYVDTVTSTTATIQMSRLHPNDINELFFEFLQDDEVIATTTELSYTFTDLQPNTQYNLSARAYCNDSTYSDTYSFSFFTTFEVICEDGNSITVSNTDASDATIGFIPGYSMYNYSYSEVIIPAEQLAGIGTVKALQFKPSATAGGGKFSNCEIYLANTTQADLADGFIQDANTFQLVWSGDMNYTSTDWQSILFDQPFEWDGNSNIVVAVRRNDGTYASGSMFEAYTSDVQLGRYVYQDSGPYTIGSISASGTATNKPAWYRLIGCEGVFDTTGSDTTCATVTIPYSTGFEDDAIDATPACWTKIGSGYTDVTDGGNGAPHNGNRLLKFKGSMSNLVVLPEVDADLNTLQLRFWTKPESNTQSSCGSFSVGYMLDTDFVEVDEYYYSEWAENAYEERTVKFSNVPADARIAMRHNAASTNWYWFVDDVTIETITVDTIVSVINWACDSYTNDLNGETYTESGTYIYEDTTNNIYNIIYLNLKHSATEDITVEAEGEFVWNDQIYTESGIYTDTLTNAEGCDSIVNLYLTITNDTVVPVVYDTIYTDAIACDSYEWNGESYYQSGEYVYVNDSLQQVSILNLTVNYSSVDSMDVVACDSYEWMGQTYNYSDVLYSDSTDANGCTHTTVLMLTINNSSFSIEEATACNAYVWHGVEYTASTDSATYTTTDVNGCDSTITLYLTIDQCSTTEITVCDSYTWHEMVFTESGMYTDGTDTLMLTINNSTSSTTEVTACDSYEWNGEVHTQGGEYSFNTTNTLGCDSTAILYLSMNFNTNASESLTVCDSVVWYDESYYVSGTYLREYEAYNGCPSVDTLFLTVNYNAVDTFYETACDSYVWGLDSNTYYYSDVYYFYNSTDEGCSYTAVLNLTINNSTSSSFDTTACDSYVWNDSLYTEGGVYSFVTTNALGCDSTAYLYLSMNYNSNSSETFTVCDSLVWYDEVYTATGTYFREYEAGNGCPSVDTLYLTVNYNAVDTFYETACDSYLWPLDSNTYSYSDVYYYSNNTDEGCLYTAVLNLTINYSTATEEDAYNVCDTFVWNNTVYTQAGDYVFNTTNVAGCDSTATLHLFLNYSSAFDTAITACDKFFWNDQFYYESGAFTFNTTNLAGCDSTVTLYLTIGNAVTSSMDVSVCDSYTWNGTTYTTSGVYTYTTEGSNGCDSIAELNLTVGESATTILNVTSCDSYVWNGQIFTTSASNVTWQTTNGNGCDSIVILNLTINNRTVSTEDITACNSYEWHGETYTASNNSATYLTTNANGCDSTVTLNLTINYSTVDTMYVTACDSYEWWGGQTFSTSGQYSYDTTNVNSCESTTILDLTINQSTSNVETITACNSYTWNGATYTTSTDNATYTTSNAVGCDSTVTLNLTVNRSSSSTIVQTVCDSYEWDDTVLTNSGMYNFISTNAVGCDSSIILNLTVNRRSASSETDTACDSYTWNGETYTVSGQYSYTTTNAAGCDSTVTLNLTIGNSTNNTETVVACNAYKWNNILYNESGVYSFSTVNETGCESISTLYLTINHSSASTETVTACDSYEWNGEVYTTSGDHTFTSTNAAGCDSTVTLNLTINNSSVSTETETACDSYTWHGTTYTSTTSTPTYTTTNAVGCDSTVTLNLTLNHSTTGIETVTACDSYTWHGSTYTSSTSTPTYTIFNAAGCDSTVTLNLTVNHSTTGTETITACNSYVWHGVEYFASTDNATFTTTNAAGCDSTITLHLTINQCSSTQIIACDSYTWHGNTYTASGMYVIDGDTLLLTINRSSSFAEIASACDSYAWNDSVYTNSGRYNYRTTNAIGCDSTVTLNLTIRYSTVSTEVITACDSYNWHGINIPTSISGLTYTTTNAAGCDSTVTLNLTINRSSTGIETVTACDNYTWYGQTYTASNGNATHTLVGSNIYGCDSTVTLHLTVNYSSQGDTVASACTFFDWYEHSNLTASQNVNHTFVGSNLSGCDSTVTLHLTINNCSTTIDTACGVYSWHGNTYTSSGIYNVGYDTLILTVFRNSFADTFAVACGSFDWYEYSDLTGSQSISRTLIAANGCDSTVTLHLTVNQCSTTEVTACGSYNWRGINFVSSGTYIIGTDTLILTIHRNTTGDTIARVCGGLDWYEYENLTTSQNVSHTFLGGNANGCDSTVTLHLTVKQCSVSTVVACDSYEWHGYTLTSSGTYTENNDTLILTINRSTSGDTLALSYGNFDWYEYTNLNSTQSVSHTFPNANAAGCDSTVTLHLLVAQIASKTSGVDTVVACDSYVWHGFTLTSSGMYPLGTDTLLLTIRRSNTSDTLASACGSFDWYEHTDLSVTQNIAHTFTGANVNGCDSTVTLHLTINQCSVSNVTACDSYTWHGLTFTSSGSYHDGLDTLNLTINHSTTGDTTATACSSFDWYEYTDMNTSQNVDRTFFAGSANGCDSTVTLHLTINHCATTVVNACDSYDWHGFTITSSGTYHVGFDTLLLTVNHSSTEDTAATACGSFTWYEHSDLTASQDVAHTFVAGNAYGCDKTVTLHLTINNCSTTRVAACGSYTWLGNTYASSGVYNVGHDTLILTINRNTTADTIATACDSFDWYEHTNLTSSQNVIHTFVGGNANGCDSTVTLHLTVNHCSNAAIEVCDSYTWHGNVYYNSGLYIDGTDTLQLVVNHSTASIESALACDSYTWHGITYTSTTSIPTYTTTNAVGCDSTVTLNLTVNYSTETTVTETATGSYTWNGNTYSESGTYYWYSTTVDGCDSTVTLILTVTTGIDDVNSEITLNVYPNPTTSWITIDADDILKVEVYDLYGRKLATHQNTDRINLQGLASGTYTLRVQTLHGTAIQRVLLK